MSSDRSGDRGRLYLVLSLVGSVLGVVSLALAVADPSWLSWGRVGVFACVTASLFMAYRHGARRRNPRTRV
ncbi:hypothetical protein OG474_29815 [Kribbella sp. NBC_01505]|uniref:hypothetical protein n=1 Tax=Kribbella sp. NBC_01505 TaxID=2903580 RepID=UPI003863E843